MTYIKPFVNSFPAKTWFNYRQTFGLNDKGGGPSFFVHEVCWEENPKGSDRAQGSASGPSTAWTCTAMVVIVEFASAASLIEHVHTPLASTMRNPTA